MVDDTEERASPKAVSCNVRDVSRSYGVLPIINVSTTCGIRASNRNDGYARRSHRAAPVHHDSSHLKMVTHFLAA